MNMKDFRALKPGDTVLWKPYDHRGKLVLRGTVRCACKVTPYDERPMIVVDDGDPENHDVMTNGFAHASWVTADRVEHDTPAIPAFVDRSRR